MSKMSCDHERFSVIENQLILLHVHRDDLQIQKDSRWLLMLDDPWDISQNVAEEVIPNLAVLCEPTVSNLDESFDVIAITMPFSLPLSKMTLRMRSMSTKLKSGGKIVALIQPEIDPVVLLSSDCDIGPHLKHLAWKRDEASPSGKRVSIMAFETKEIE